MSARTWQRCLAELRQCESAGGRAARGGYSIEGLRLFERALRADAPLEFAVLSERLRDDPSPRERALLSELARRPTTELVFAPDTALREHIAGRTFGDCLGFVRLAPAPELATVFTEPGPGVVLVAVDAEDPGNVGALVRSAFVAGARAFCAVGLCEPHHPKAVRTSMGSLFRLPILHYRDATELLAALAAAEVWSVGAVATGGVAPRELSPPHSRSALLVGSEAFGLSAELAEALDARTTIPMRVEVDSYSVTAAAASRLSELTSGG